jgi:four helix bundle protein
MSEQVKAGIRWHQDLRAWQAAMALVKEIYAVTSSFPKEEIYGLTSQMRRAAVSVPSNIAEGAARSGTREFVQFLTVARGSLSELETQLHICRELGYVHDTCKLESVIEELFRIISGLIESLKNRTR